MLEIIREVVKLCVRACVRAHTRAHVYTHQCMFVHIDALVDVSMGARSQQSFPLLFSILHFGFWDMVTLNLKLSG